MTDSIPVIDLKPLFEDGDAGRLAVAREIGEACRGIGFFYLKGHGVPAERRESVFAMARTFFESPDDLKMKTAYSRDTGNRGYVPMKGESLDPTKAPDLKEGYNIGLDLAEDDPEILARAPLRALNLWPDVPGFREIMLDYYDAMLSLGRTLHTAFATELGLDPDFFDDKLRRPLATLRLLHYPESPAEMEEGQLGAGEHTDYGCVTLLATDDAGGLEVRTRDGEWLSAPYIPDTFICNIGDCLMRWTNDLYVSTPHRVINPSGRERYSVPFFLDPDPDAIVACLPGCSGEDSPAKYPPIRGDDYLLSRLNPTYEKSGLVTGAIN
ncbi:isopenicillin N synthase family dioxygenase [Roseibium marinum]|uniref:Isopenicillin N synthase-like dioxygenase n=1 Tax=Roseibium marinum TaxID=281252 RepID=A0A2S3UT12_9HYPH|nr:2-oxoglutarate and iron-dependent oxygenase domain-containing protein [Roseibium marinum]POF30851.1 isopenicillin N synthase-like dioxygenase [Roseibium marinum]